MKCKFDVHGKLCASWVSTRVPKRSITGQGERDPLARAQSFSSTAAMTHLPDVVQRLTTVGDRAGNYGGLQRGPTHAHIFICVSCHA